MIANAAPEASEGAIYGRTKSVAIVVEAPASVLRAAPPYEFDGHIEEPMDYTPIEVGKLAAPDYPDEEWPAGAGPLGF